MATKPPLYDPSRRPFGLPDPVEADEPEPAEPGISTRTLVLGVVAAAILASALATAIAWAFADRPQTVSFAGSSTEAGENLALAGEALDVQAVLAKVQPSVVTITTNQESRASIFEGAGSGVMIDDEGLILTNAHVINDADLIEVTFFNGQTFEATVVGSFQDEDLAVIRAVGVADTQPADLGSVEATRVGDQVLAIGNALGLGGLPTVTQGIVSAKDREITSGRLVFSSLIQTDAAINPGNSGGPLVNAAGEVIGINTAIIEGANNLGFAISIDVVIPLIDQLLDGGGSVTPETAWFGASTTAVSSASTDQLQEFAVDTSSGVLVIDVFDNASAGRAGLRPGDVIIEVNGKPVASSEDLAREVRRFDPGDVIGLRYLRDGAEIEVDVALGSRADAGG